MRISIVLIVMVLTLMVFSIGTYADTTNTFAGIGSNDNSVGSTAWSNTNNIGADDSSTARATIPDGSSSNYLKGTSFGFSIPTGATIDGIEVTLERSTQWSNSVKDTHARIVKSDASIGTTDKSNTNFWDNVGTEVITYGGSTDLWGESWAASDINSANFGFAVAADNVNCCFSSQSDIDYIQITVYYTYTAPATNITNNITMTMGSGVIEIQEGVLQFT